MTVEKALKQQNVIQFAADSLLIAVVRTLTDNKMPYP